MTPIVASKLAEANHPVACPTQWLPVLLASDPVPPTHRRRLLDNVFTSKTKLKTHKSRKSVIDLVVHDGQQAVRKQFIGQGYSRCCGRKKTLPKQEGFALEVAVLERLRATMQAEKRSGGRDEACYHERHLPYLLSRNDTTLTFETTMDGYPLSTPQGQDLFCAIPLHDITRQDQCVTATMKKANVRHLDIQAKNMLVQEGKNHTNRLTVYDFDLSSIDGWDGHADHMLKPVTELTGYTITGMPYAKRNVTAKFQWLYLMRGELGLSDLHENMCCGGKRCKTFRLSSTCDLVHKRGWAGGREACAGTRRHR